MFHLKWNYKWSFCVCHFTKDDAFKVHVVVFYKNFFPIYSWIICQYMFIPYFVYLFMCGGTFGFVTRVYVPQSSQQRFGVMDIKAPSACHSSQVLDRPCYSSPLRSWIDRVIALRSRMDHVIALRQISVTAQCYSCILFRRSQDGAWGHVDLKTRREERPSAQERERASFGSSIYMFISPWACPV